MVIPKEKIYTILKSARQMFLGPKECILGELFLFFLFCLLLGKNKLIFRHIYYSGLGEEKGMCVYVCVCVSRQFNAKIQTYCFSSIHVFMIIRQYQFLKNLSSTVICNL